MDSLAEDIDQASTPKKMRMNSHDEMTGQIKNYNREGQDQELKSLRLHLNGF